MKKRFIASLIFILALILMVGCGGAKQEEVQEEFLEMIKEPATEKRVIEIADFLDDNIKYMKVEDGDQMLVAYCEYVATFDGSYLNYYRFEERYGQHMSEALKDLCYILGLEQEKPAVEDAALQITWEELCQRAAYVEAYIVENKEYETVKAEASWIYEYYINAMLMGATKTPVFSYETGAFSEEAKTVYLSIAEEYPQTMLAWVLEEYFDYLNEIQYTLNYKDAEQNKAFFDTCSYLASEAGKRVYQ